MKDFIICGIQQAGIGVADMPRAWAWYRKHFGMNIKVFEEAAEAKLMLPYTGGQPASRHAALAINLQGGGGFEIWQYTSRTPEPPKAEVLMGDLGIYAVKVKCRDANKTHAFLKSNNAHIRSEPAADGRGNRHFFVEDPYGNIFDIVENNTWFKNEGRHTGGTFGAVIGVSDVAQSKKFYKDVLGYDKVLYEKEGVFEDFKGLPRGDAKMHRVLLTHREPRSGRFSRLLGPSEIELVKAVGYAPKKIFEGRLWGDLGFIHLCFDIVGMEALKQKCADAGHPFTVDSFANLDASFDMGEAAGHFSYIEDPDGALIEFVETHKIPVSKKIGWYLDLGKKDPRKPIPDYILKAMAFNRVKD